MTVKVSMGGWAVRYTGVSETLLELPGGACVADALGLLGLPPEQTGMTAVNMAAAGAEHVLRDGDELKIYPPIIGG